jgi:hypothetical protein
LRARCIVDGFGGMGTKYLPTNKDRIASKRFQRKQEERTKNLPVAGGVSAKKAKKR